MEALLVKYGYLLLFLGVALEGEAFLLAGAFLANRGYFHLPVVMLVAIAANCTADQIYYLVARSRGRLWLERRFGNHPRYRRVLELMSRYSTWLLLCSRYAFGFRIIIPAACGALGMPVLIFSMVNLLAGIIWAVPTALLGFYFGSAAEVLLDEIRRYEVWILFLFLLSAAMVLLVRHVRRAGWVDSLTIADLHAVVPFLMGLMGAINIISAIWPRSQVTLAAVESWLPLEVRQQSRPLMLFAGLALLQVTRNLSRRKELAWYVATIALSISLLLHVTRAFDIHHSLVAGLLLTYLMYFRRRFHARSDPVSLKWGLLMVPVLGLIAWSYAFVGLTHMRGEFDWLSVSTPASAAFHAAILIRDPGVSAKTSHAAHFLGSVQIAGWLSRLYLLILLLRPVVLRRRMEAPAEDIGRIFKAYSRYSLSAFAVQNDKHHLLVAAGQGLVGYAVRGSVALACGDPLAPEEELEKSVLEYCEYSRKNGWSPCFYEAAESRLPVYESLGLRCLKIAEEALLDLKEFSLAGGRRANLRAMVNKALKSEMQVRRYNRSVILDAGVDEQLEEISEEWLAEKALGEMGFTLGRFSLETLGETYAFLCATGQRVEAFCTWLPYRDGAAMVLDLMRKRRDAPAGTMDLLLAHSLLQLKAAGLCEASLANAPLANVGKPRGPLDRGVALLFENMNAFYGYKNLFQFKKKFAPRWEGRYLVYPKGADLPRIAYSLTSLHSSGGFMRLLLKR